MSAKGAWRPGPHTREGERNKKTREAWLGSVGSQESRGGMQVSQQDFQRSEGQGRWQRQRHLRGGVWCILG